MALGIVPDKVFEQEVDKYLNATVITKTPHGRKPGSENVPESIQRIIGDTNLESGRKAGQELAELFGVHPRSADSYAKGVTSLGAKKNPELSQHIEKTKGRIARRAGKLAIRALESITDEKLQEAKAGELAAVARSASAIVKEMEPPVANSSNAGPQVQFVIHAPTIVKEEKFDVIDVVSSDE